MPIVHTPKVKPEPCRHPERPDVYDVNTGTRFYCDRCHRVFAAYCREGAEWGRWPIDSRRAFWIFAPLVLTALIWLAVILHLAQSNP